MDDVIKQVCRDLRKNMTEKEDTWLKRYLIPDFLCIPEKLVIEVDWSIHDIPKVLQLDKHKEELLKNRWYKILRFTNTEIQTNIQNVLETIQCSFTYPSEMTEN